MQGVLGNVVLGCGERTLGKSRHALWVTATSPPVMGLSGYVTRVVTAPMVQLLEIHAVAGCNFLHAYSACMHTVYR